MPSKTLSMRALRSSSDMTDIPELSQVSASTSATNVLFGPGLHRRRKALDGRLVAFGEKTERAAREHHAEAVRRVGRILLHDANPVIGVRALYQVGEIKPGGPAPHYFEIHASPGKC